MEILMALITFKTRTWQETPEIAIEMVLAISLHCFDILKCLVEDFGSISAFPKYSRSYALCLVIW